MNCAPEHQAPTANDAAATAGELPPPSPATTVADMLNAWANLLTLEVALARRSLRWLLIGAIAVPVIGLGAWLVLSALFVVVMHTYTNSWLLALLFGAGVNCLALGIVLRQLRRWARDLALPQSRAALARAMERMT